MLTSAAEKQISKEEDNNPLTLSSTERVSAIIPTSNAAGLIRYYFGLLPLSQEAVLVRWLILIVTTAVFIMLTSAKAKWRET
jgi:hypothetical protein